MPKECAFCPHEGKLSAEHVVSDWMKSLFPGKKLFTRRNRAGQIISQTIQEEIDWTAKVVCEKCNNTWMSNIESQHAKPAMTALMIGKKNVPIPQASAHSIALFAFKTAVVLDHTQRKREPFFSRRVRYAFRQHLDIPRTLHMWMAGFASRTSVHFHTGYYKGTLPPSNPLEMYICTCGIGHFVFQVVAQKQIGFTGFYPRTGFEKLAVPLWPRVWPQFVWPAANVLRTLKDFDAFSERWKDVFPSR
jgi:hypothetical protein